MVGKGLRFWRGGEWWENHVLFTSKTRPDQSRSVPDQSRSVLGKSRSVPGKSFAQSCQLIVDSGGRGKLITDGRALMTGARRAYLVVKERRTILTIPYSEREVNWGMGGVDS